MTLLILYLALAIGVSFVCSLCEAVLLTLTVSDAEVLRREGSSAGLRLREFKREIDRPLAAILTLNTISHTIGAAGVGAQSILVFGNAWLGLSSALLTLLILVVSEIIPKTIGATKARVLATPATWTILFMMWLTYPAVIALDAISRALRGKKHPEHLSREQIAIVAEMARSGGALRKVESDLLMNMLLLENTRVKDVMTPRTVLRTLPSETTAEGALNHPDALHFSRIPITGKDNDDVRGFVLKHDVHRAIIEGRRTETLDSMLRPIRAVPESANLVAVMEQFAETSDHVFHVVDEYGGTAGLITLEDVFEEILGAEIVDETDPVVDMRELVEKNEPKQLPKQ